VIRLLTSVLLVGLALGCASRLTAAEKPNVVFILADDLGWGDLGCYGNRDTRTPNLDMLAAGGTLFTHFYVNGSVCSPSRCAFLTGQFPARHKIHGHYATPEQNTARGMSQFLDPATPTLPRLLKEAGYATAHIGKWHLGSGPGAPEPAAYGFDLVRSVNAANQTWVEQNADPYFRAKSSALFVDEGVKFIEANKGRPFYLQLWMLVPHATLNPTDEQLKPFGRLAPGGKDFPHKSARQVYYASLADLDTQVGRLMRKLDELKLADNTLVVFSSDNGPEEIAVRNAGHSGVGSPGPFRGRKRSLYEGGVRVPFLVRWPAAVKPGRVDDASVVCGADLLPTVCKLAGVEVPEGHALDGEDRSAVLVGEPAPRTKPLFWEWRFNVAGPVLNRPPTLAMRDGKWKLLMNPDRSRVELYDIPADPSELNNLADRQSDVVKRMSERLLAWRKTLPDGPADATAGKNDYPWPKPKESR
jgi:N-acetylgalactosamine-6-sulfatase